MLIPHVQPVLCKKCVSGDHIPVLIRRFLSSLSGDHFTVHNKTQPGDPDFGST